MDRDEHQMILDVAVMYYLEDKSQSQIAKELFTSISKVSRILKKARENNIVEININYKCEVFEELQALVRKRFDLPNIIITKTIGDEIGTLKEVSRMAAKELGLILHDGITVGISWGRHLSMTSKYLSDKAYKNVSVVELFGAISHQQESIDAKTLGREICNKLNAKLYPLYAPIYVYDEIGHKEVMNSKVVKDTLDKIEECDLVITSIGAVETDNLQVLWHNYLESDMRVEVKNHKGVGFILAHFFDEQGKFIESKINNSVIGIETDKVKEQNIFAIASGTKKAKAILGALRGGILNTLVTDEKTIKRVLELADME